MLGKAHLPPLDAELSAPSNTALRLVLLMAPSHTPCFFKSRPQPRAVGSGFMEKGTELEKVGQFVWELGGISAPKGKALALRSSLLRGSGARTEPGLSPGLWRYPLWGGCAGSQLEPDLVLTLASSSVDLGDVTAAPRRLL